MRIIVADAPRYLADGGTLLMEHGYDQAENVRTLLAARGPWGFQDLKGELDMSDGNLISHLRTLAKEGYVREDKTTALDSERPRTTYEITSAGRSAFKGYIKVLEAIDARPKASA